MPLLAGVGRPQAVGRWGRPTEYSDRRYAMAKKKAAKKKKKK
jgi:hypothetical protein